MSTRYSNTQDDDASPGRRRPRKASGPPVGPILILVVWAAAGIITSVRTFRWE